MTVAGTLPYTLPASVDQLPFDFKALADADPLFPPEATAC